MKIIVKNPIKAFIYDASEDELKAIRSQLTYINTANQYAVKRHYANKWLKSKNKVAWEMKLEELKSLVKNTLVFTENGETYIRPGSIPYLTDLDFTVESQVKYPVPKKVAWAKPLPFTLHDYQEQSVEKLIAEKHGAVSLCTGSGKTFAMLKFCRETGFRTIIVTPSRSIFNELLEKFEHHLGKGQVGAYGDGKKRLGKRFTVCIGDSLVNLKPGTPEWDFFSLAEAMLVDESHSFASETLEKVCHGVLDNVPYRAFLSGTQTRGDGTKSLLESIIGKIVHTLPTHEAVKKGYVCPHEFKIVSIPSSNPNIYTSDVLQMKREHYLRNKNIAHFIAKLANAHALKYGKQSLILVEELSQIAMLIPLLEVPYGYAHSESSKQRLQEAGIEKVDSAEQIEKFNKNEIKVLIGTMAVSVGTNIYPTHNTFNFQGGSSEIRCKQGVVGRSVRFSYQNPFKDKCLNKEKAVIWDFDVYDVHIMHLQLEDRIEHYKDSFEKSEDEEISFIKFK